MRRFLVLLWVAACSGGSHDPLCEGALEEQLGESPICESEGDLHQTFLDACASAIEGTTGTCKACLASLGYLYEEGEGCLYGFDESGCGDAC
jgi:hypothetical protein